MVHVRVAPVAIDERQTGVSDGKTDARGGTSPCSARSASVGARRSSTARSNATGVSPSMTIRTSFLPHFASVRSPA